MRHAESNLSRPGRCTVRGSRQRVQHRRCSHNDAPIIHEFLCYNNRVNLGTLLEKSLDSTHVDLIRRIANDASEFGFPVYLVGGSVRDLLLSRPITDIDLTFEGNAISLTKSLAQKYSGKLTIHRKFQTVMWELPGSKEYIDLVSARKETYAHPGALPTVTRSTIDDDLRRRDFTINAMAIRLDGSYFGELYDPLNGQQDLKQNIIRALHPRSFLDDPTRIFRAARSEGRNGFRMEPDTLKQVNVESLAVLKKLSGRRILRELDLNFDEPKFHVVIERLKDLTVLDALKLPPFNNSYKDLLDEIPKTELGAPCDRVTLGWILWLVDSDPAKISTLAARLRFNSRLTKAIIAASMLKNQLPGTQWTKPSEWTFALEEYPVVSIYAVHLITRQAELLEFILNWRHVKPVITGDDLKKRGLESGPRYSEILSLLRAAWLDGIVNKDDEEKRLVDELFK